MQVDYTPFIGRVISRYEGDYGWNKKDPGGPTKYGITCFDLAEHRHLKMTSMAAWAPTVQAMTLAEAEDIYKTKYAAAIRFDDLPPGVDCCMLDYGINSGTARPIRVARALVKLPQYAVMDQSLLDAIKKYDQAKFCKAMDAERLQFMHAIKGGAMWAEFGHGWGSRVADLDAYCAHLAAGKAVAAAPDAIDLTHVVTPKATHVAKTAGGVTAGSTLGAPAVAHLTGFPLWQCGLIAGGILAAGIGYEAWQAQKAAAANIAVVLPAGA
jgi:lysozyme family protein